MYYSDITLYVDEKRTVGRMPVTMKQSGLGLSHHSGIFHEELIKGRKLSLSFFVCIWERAKYRTLFGDVYSVATFLTKTSTLIQM
jgi:hypothetical protein